jgi:carbonic anhydrase
MRGSCRTAEATACGGNECRRRQQPHRAELLTTPPCTEGITWFVLKDAATLSAQQLATFAKLYPANNRPIQPAYQREILETK